jgi:hypothetical protein
VTGFWGRHGAQGLLRKPGKPTRPSGRLTHAKKETTRSTRKSSPAVGKSPPAGRKLAPGSGWKTLQPKGTASRTGRRTRTTKHPSAGSKNAPRKPRRAPRRAKQSIHRPGWIAAAWLDSPSALNQLSLRGGESPLRPGKSPLRPGDSPLRPGKSTLHLGKQRLHDRNLRAPGRVPIRGSRPTAHGTCREPRDR